MNDEKEPIEKEKEKKTTLDSFTKIEMFGKCLVFSISTAVK